MERLNRGLAAKQSLPHGPVTPMPIRVAMIGEGVFLRTFVAWMIDILNEKHGFNGGIAVIKPIPGVHNLPDFAAQDCVYTVLLRGLLGGRTVEEAHVVTSIQSITGAYDDFPACLRLFAADTLRFVFSNTTEAGIAWGEDGPDDLPPATYPGKLAALLRARFKAFAGDPAKGLHIIPCELIEKNGETLRTYVLRHLRAWGDEEAARWVERACTFTDTLVDRIVTGYPKDEAEEICARLGYEDRLLTTGEPFALFCLQGDGAIDEELPLVRCGLPAVWDRSIKAYRDRKVYILNGAHTLLSSIAPLCGVHTVRQAVEDGDIGPLLSRALKEEIMPFIALPEEVKTAFCDAVMERFANPFMVHQLASISLNAISKFGVRDLPSLAAYARKHGKAPARLTLALAGLLVQARSAQNDGDAPKVCALWERAGGDAGAMARLALSAEGPFGDAGCLPGVTDALTRALAELQAGSMRDAVRQANA